MSIIYDALKKIEKKEGVIPQGKEPEAGDKRKKGFPWVLILIPAIVISASLFILHARKRAVVKAKDIAEVVLPVAPIPIAQEDYSNTTSGNEFSPGDYVLEGIIYSREDPVAIINGKIFKVKEKVDDLEVANITPDNVELVNPADNSTISLSLK